MTTKPKTILKRRLSFFEDQGSGLEKYPLIRAAYFDDTEKAQSILATDPDQLNLTDPFAGLTALHIAVFRENECLVDLFAKHPQIKPHLKDNFGRRAIDMLDYTANQRIFETVVDATFPEEMRTLEDEAYEQGVSDGGIVPFKPKEP